MVIKKKLQRALSREKNHFGNKQTLLALTIYL